MNQVSELRAMKAKYDRVMQMDTFTAIVRKLSPLPSFITPTKTAVCNSHKIVYKINKNLY